MMALGTKHPVAFPLRVFVAIGCNPLKFIGSELHQMTLAA
jgi:hypothetical protein